VLQHVAVCWSLLLGTTDGQTLSELPVYFILVIFFSFYSHAFLPQDQILSCSPLSGRCTYTCTLVYVYLVFTLYTSKSNTPVKPVAYDNSLCNYGVATVRRID